MATGYYASGERSYSTKTTAAPTPTDSSRTSRSCVRIAQNPATTVHVQDCGQEPRGPAWLHDADSNVTHVCGDGDPLLVDQQLLEWRRLDVVESLPRPFGSELIEQRRLCSSIGERLRRWLERWPVHDPLPGG